MATKRNQVVTFEYVPAMVNGHRPASIQMSRERAEMEVARGLATWADDGTRRIFARSVRPRGTVRHWAKTRCYDPDTRSTVHTMQLVPGLGR